MLCRLEDNHRDHYRYDCLATNHPQPGSILLGVAAVGSSVPTQAQADVGRDAAASAWVRRRERHGYPKVQAMSEPAVP